MEDSAYRTWDVAIKIVGLIGLLLGGGIGIAEYVSSANREAKLETANYEADQGKLLLAKQTELYFDVTRLAAKLATEGHTKTRAADTQNWLELYYGPMVIVEDRTTGSADNSQRFPEKGGRYAEDRNVELRMIAFNSCLLDTNCSDTTLQNRSLQLADACRLSLTQTTKARVDDLRNGLSVKLLGQK